MPRGRWAWIADVWRVIAADRLILVLLVAALILCGGVLLLIWR
jgi:hypothetical protein